MNIPDKNFNSSLKDLNGIILADQGFRDKDGVPDNFKICKKGSWNCRMFIETLFSLWTRICNFKRSFHRTVNGFKAKVSYLVALTNIIFSTNESLGFKMFPMKQWAL